MANAIMILGTMSNVGKSYVAAGLCRIFRQDGWRVCPFKSQNMALNSFITKEGLEMGRAQVVQAEAAGIEPSVKMNPILLKPNSDTGSQVIVNGVVRGNMKAMEYYKRKREFLPDILASYHALEKEYDVIVIEGAGSPAEINLKENDFVNMGMAKLADAPALLVGDIDRGGVFAQLYGTVGLLEEDERRRVRGFIVNKFRGDPRILEPGLRQIEALTGIPVVGTLPYARLDLDEEDSQSERLHGWQGERPVKIAVVRLPHMSNYTDFAALEQYAEASVYYADAPEGLHEPDIIFLPGTKNTIADLLALRENGMEAAVQKHARRGTVIFGICGGYQMLGETVADLSGVETEGGKCIRGMGLLPVRTYLGPQKRRTHIAGRFGAVSGALAGLSGRTFAGYEIHHGRTEPVEAGRAQPLVQLESGVWDGAQRGNVYGAYIHGIFDEAEVSGQVVRSLLAGKGMDADGVLPVSRKDYKERQYDRLADVVRDGLDMERVYGILSLKKP